MSSVRLTSKKTLPILLKALALKQFSQTQLSQETQVSIGRVNKIITWLKEKDVITKEGGKYHITQPNRLADMIAEQQIITKTRTYHLTITQKELEEESKQTQSETCLRSSLQTHDAQQTTSQSHYLDTETLRKALDKYLRGDHIVNLYSYDSQATHTTEAIRTIIDLRSTGERHRTQVLAQQIWGTNQ